MENTFLTQFISISNIETIIFLFVFIGISLILKNMAKKKISFSTRVLFATVAGLIIGFVIQAMSGFVNDPSSVSFVRETTLWYGLIGNGFVGFIRMLVIPLVMVSIIHVILHMEEGTHVKKLVQRGIVTTMGMVAVAAIIGLLFGILFHIGGDANAIQQESASAKEIVPVVTTLLNLIPANPIEAMIQNNIVGIVIFSTFIGLAARKMQKKYPDILSSFIHLIDALHKIVISMALMVIKAMPYAVLALLANTIAQRGISSIIEVGKFIILIYVSCGVMMVLQLCMLAIYKVNPFIYLKKSFSTLLLAFTSRSSLGVLPATIEVLEKEMGVSSGTANFVASFGTTAGMQGCAGIFPALLIVYVANTTGMTIDFSFFLMAVLVITIGSIGIAGIPGTSTMAASVGLSGTGLGGYFSFITPILAIDPIIDMVRTMLNVSGSMTNAILVDRQLGLMNMEIYHNKTIDLEKEDD